MGDKTAVIVRPSAENENGKSYALRGHGFSCVPEIGYNHYRRVETTDAYHMHAGCVELVFCLKGVCVYSTPDGDFSFRSGAVFVSQPNQPHMLKTYHKNLRLYWIRFRVGRGAPAFLGLPPAESRWIVSRLREMPNRVFRGSEALCAAFRRVFALCEDPILRTGEGRVRLRATLLDLALSALDAGEARPNVPLDAGLAAIADQMRSAPERSYPLEKLSKDLGVSVSTLMQSFKRQIGFSPHAFLLSCRIGRAKRLLADGASVSATANLLGFSTQKRFSSYFRQTVGCTPRAWRQSAKSS